MSDSAVDLSTLKALGISPDALIDKIVDRAVTELLESNDYDYDYDGEPVGRSRQRVMEQIQTKIVEAINARVDAIADEHVLPKVAEMIETMTLQQTNKWGEKTGSPVTFIEYLTQRADHYMREEVDYQGKPKGTDSYSWTKHGTRVAYMVNSHLQYSIETAMKQAFAQANSSIKDGLESAVKISLGNVLAKLKVDVKTS